MLTEIKIVLDNGAIMPTRAHETDAGLDLYTPANREVPGMRECFSIDENGDHVSAVVEGSCTIDTGVHVQIPAGYVGMVKSKSGLNVKHGLTAEGVIDAGYTGSIVVKLYNHTAKTHYFCAGDKIAQLVIMPIETPAVVVVDKLEETERGENGFGSSGR